jgi:hypothetical protein
MTSHSTYLLCVLAISMFILSMDPLLLLLDRTLFVLTLFYVIGASLVPDMTMHFMPGG